MELLTIHIYNMNTRTIQKPKRRQIQPSERRMKTVVLDDVGRSVERERERERERARERRSVSERDS